MSTTQQHDDLLGSILSADQIKALSYAGLVVVPRVPTREMVEPADWDAYEADEASPRAYSPAECFTVSELANTFQAPR